MKIESCVQSTRCDRFTVTFDTGKKLRVEASVVADCGLYDGKELSEEAYAALLQTAGKASAKARAVRIIAAAGVSEKDLRSRLIAKGEKTADAEEAVQWLSELGLLDDASAAKNIAERAAAKGYGPARIRQMLYQKGIPKELWEDALADLPEPDGAIDAFLARRLNGRTPDADEVRKLSASLARRGHGWSAIRAALERYQSGLEEYLED